LLKYIVKRVLQLIPILLAVSVLIFILVRIAPSDPIASMTKGKHISEETRQALEQQYHLNQSQPEQYLIWITDTLRGDLGESYQHKQAVTTLVGERLPTTLQLVFMSALLAVLIALPIGIVSAVKMNTAIDRVLSVLTLVFVSSPYF
jgi:peptide/nickel transport system permease protein